MSLPLSFRSLAVCWCLAVICPVFSRAAEANLIPIGSEYSIVSSSAGDQTSPQVALSPDGTGGYLVWQDNSVTARGTRIKAQQLDGGFNPLTSPFTISSAWKSKATGDQNKPQVAMLPGGAAVVVWQGGKPGKQRIYARFIRTNGRFLKSDVRVSKFSKNPQQDAGVVVLADGTVVISWASFGRDGSLEGIFAQKFSADGRKIGAEFQVNQWSAYNQRNPSIAALADGGFVITWISELQRGPASVDVFVRVFDLNGLPVGPEFPVNTSTNQLCANPSVTASPEGGFVVAWGQRDNGVLTLGSGDDIGVKVSSTNSVIAPGIETVRSDNSWDIFARGFSNSGSTSEIVRLNTYRHGDQYGPQLGVNGQHYMAIWTSLGQDGSREGIFGQGFTVDGMLEGDELAINTTTVNRQLQPSLASDTQGKFLTVWSGFVARNGQDLFAQIFDLSLH